MSVEATSWVWTHSRARGNDRLVLLAIADHAWSDGTNAFPSQARLAEFTLLSESTVRRCIRSLEQLGELVTELGAGPPKKGADGRWRASNGYRMVLATGGQADRPSRGRAVKSARTGGQIGHDGRSAVTAEPSTNPEEPARAREGLCPTHRFPLRGCRGCAGDAKAAG